jgi:hypothetical protein
VSPAHRHGIVMPPYGPSRTAAPGGQAPWSGSNETEPDQLATARQQGDADGAALQAMQEEDGAAVAEAGNYRIALVNEQAEGMYAADGDGGLVWRKPGPDASPRGPETQYAG